MFIIDGLADPEIWRTGDLAGENRGKPALARTDIPHKALLELKMMFAQTPDEHPRHVNVGSWPVDKDEQKALALEFCAKSVLYLRRTSGA
jgi:hypothetical protein